MKFAIFEHSEPELKWLVYDLIQFSTYHCNQVRIKLTKVDALWFFSKAPCLFHICKNFDARTRGDIFDSLPVWSDVHKLEKVSLALVSSGSSSLCCIELDVVGEHCFCFETDCPMKFSHFHSAFYVELKRFAENHVAFVWQQRANELATKRVTVT